MRISSHVVASSALACTFAACNRSTEPTIDSPAPPLSPLAKVHDFEDDSVGQAPLGFKPVLAGDGSEGRWAVRLVEDATGTSRQSVAQTGDDGTSNRFPLLVRDDLQARDLDLSVALRTISGEEDASGGLVFRYRDRDNFYVVRANSLEDNVVAYKMEGGDRRNLGVTGRGDAYGVKIDVPHRQWNTLRVIVRDTTFEVFLNGRKLFEVQDATFSTAGQVGLWTKADAVTEFDDLRVQSLDLTP